MAAASVGGKAIFVGGVVSNGANSSAASAPVDIYDAVTDRWSVSVPLTHGPYYSPAIVIGSKMFFVSLSSAAIDIYDSMNDSWSVMELPPICSVRLAAAVSVLGRKGAFIFQTHPLRIFASYDSNNTCPTAKRNESECVPAQVSANASPLPGGLRFALGVTAVCDKVSSLPI